MTITDIPIVINWTVNFAASEVYHVQSTYPYTATTFINTYPFVHSFIDVDTAQIYRPEKIYNDYWRKNLVNPRTLTSFIDRAEDYNNVTDIYYCTMSCIYG